MICFGGGHEAGNLVLTSVLVIIPRDELAKLLGTVLVQTGTDVQSIS